MLWEESIFLAALGLSLCPDSANENGGGAATEEKKRDNAPKAINPGVDAACEAADKPPAPETKERLERGAGKATPGAGPECGASNKAAP